MRLLNFTNIPIAIDQLKSGGSKISTSGGWMAALLAKVLANPDITLGCAAFGNVNKLQTTQEGRVTSFVMPFALNNTRVGLKMCRDIVNEWRPDLIHIHGTENIFGLLSTRGHVNCPVVISIQGLLGPSSEWYRYFGNRNLMEIFSMHRWLEIPALRGHWLEFIKIKRMAKVERECIIGNKFFIGRTVWDRSYVKALNSSANYFHGGELLREHFWLKKWSISEAKRYRIIFVNAGHPRKGSEVVFDAVRLLQLEYPAIQVAIAGWISQKSGYGRYIRKKMDSLGHAAIELGPLNAEQMANEMVASHVFVSPSFIENSSNACCEAQLMGLPVISSYTGGMPTLIQEGITGLFFPTGDAPMLAARLREVFEDEDLATRLGAKAREVACRRHDPDFVLNGILNVYEAVMRQVQ